MSAYIRFFCPTCKAVLEAPVASAGLKINCLKCGQRLQIPPAERAQTILAPGLGIHDDSALAPPVDKNSSIPTAQFANVPATPRPSPAASIQVNPFTNLNEPDDPVNVKPPPGGLSITSMILGIIGLSLTMLAVCCGLLSSGVIALPIGGVSLILAVLAIVFGSIGQKRRMNGFATAGIYAGWTTIALLALAVLVMVLLIGVVIAFFFNGGKQ